MCSASGTPKQSGPAFLSNNVTKYLKYQVDFLVVTIPCSTESGSLCVLYKFSVCETISADVHKLITGFPS